VTEILASSVYADGAAKLAAVFAHYPALRRFAAIVGQLARPM